MCWPADGPAPLDAAAHLFEPDLAKFAESWDVARRRVPALRAAPIARVVHGPEAFTPDGEFLLGETSVRRLLGGGRLLRTRPGRGRRGRQGDGRVDRRRHARVRRVPHGHPPFRRARGSRSWATAKALDAYSRYYDIVYPGPGVAGRPGRCAARPTWPRLSELDAAPRREGRLGAGQLVRRRTPPHGDDRPAPGGWAGRNWSPAIEAECLATTDAAGLFDQSSFAKLDVRGAGRCRLPATAVRQRRRPAGRHASSTPSCSTSAAGIEADLTVTRLGEDHFRVVTSTASGGRDAAWLRRHAPDGVTVDDVTGAYGCLCLWGPARPGHPAAADRRRAVQCGLPVHAGPAITRRLRAGTGPAGDVRRRARLGAVRPTEYALTLWDTLIDAGAPFGLRPAGYRAIDAMRLEKGYRVWGSDITPETTPDEAGLGFAVRTGQGLPRPDRAAAPRRAAAGRGRRLRCLTLADPAAVCLGTEPVRVDGRPVRAGHLRRVRLPGRRVDRVRLSSVHCGRSVTASQVGVFGTWRDATVRDEPLFDPTNARVRA